MPCHRHPQVMRLDVAPVLFLLRRMDLLPLLLRLLSDLKGLAQLLRPKSEAPEVTSPKEALKLRPPTHWQLFLRAQVEAGKASKASKACDLCIFPRSSSMFFDFFGFL